MPAALDAFRRQKYLSLESYRRDGRAVRTPVWFAESGDELYVYTEADSGKIKRMRNNPQIKIAPCDMRGNIRGAWVAAVARFVTGAEATQANRLLTRKYKLKLLFDLTGKLRRRGRDFLAIRPS